jgi:hypothetical protein
VTERGSPIGYHHLQEITILMLATITLSVTRTVVGVGIVQIMYTFESASFRAESSFSPVALKQIHHKTNTNTTITPTLQMG